MRISDCDNIRESIGDDAKLVAYVSDLALLMMNDGSYAKAFAESKNLRFSELHIYIAEPVEGKDGYTVERKKVIVKFVDETERFITDEMYILLRMLDADINAKDDYYKMVMIRQAWKYLEEWEIERKPAAYIYKIEKI